MKTFHYHKNTINMINILIYLDYLLAKIMHLFSKNGDIPFDLYNEIKDSIKEDTIDNDKDLDKYFKL